MRQVFWSIFLGEIEEIQNRLNSMDEKVVWEIASQNTRGTLERLAVIINNIAFPELEDIRCESELIQRRNPDEIYES